MAQTRNSCKSWVEDGPKTQSTHCQVTRTGVEHAQQVLWHHSQPASCLQTEQANGQWVVAFYTMVVWGALESS